ncbi:sensor histidine kinase [Halorubrum halodurans]|uniref:sensor histidine kinase n=1 Tax=Halorubrum halodurans TaxID=1383851 RepID=UPI002AA2A68F|nr:histidine kinase N-terminal 7TM domain-containing protein [Halorubrum halodurans]
MRTRGWSYLVGSIGLLGFNNAVWVLAATLKTASTDLQLSLLFYKLELLGFLPNTVVAIVMALAYVGRDRWLTRRTFALLGVVPTAFVLLTLVNPGDVMIVDPKLIPAQGVLAFEHEFPPLFGVYLAWLYGAVLVAILILAWGTLTDRVPTVPGLVGVLALLLPLVVAVLKTVGVYPPGGDGINVSPAASAIGISVFAFAIVRYRVFELVPVGRDRAVEVMADGYLFVGPNETVRDANPTGAELLVGDASARLRGSSVNEVVPVYDDLTGTDSVDLEIAGRIVEVSRSEVTRQNWAAGEVLLLHDVTEQRRQLRELERTNERLDEFAGIVSHDLRNPLNVAKGTLSLERDANDSERLATASQALDRMEILIDDVLTLARQGQPISDPEPTTLSSVVNECWEVVDTHNATLTVESDLTLEAHRDRLQQLLENLVRNAIEHGGSDVAIRVGALPEADGFYVADNGPGIPDDERDDAFESGYSTVESGTGFGLERVKEIADAHGWTIRVTDRSA